MKKSIIPNAREQAKGFPPLETHSRICNANMLHLSGYFTIGGEQSTTIPLTAVFTALIELVLL